MTAGARLRRTDSSNYRQVPVARRIPFDEDVSETLALGNPLELKNFETGNEIKTFTRRNGKNVRLNL